MLLSLCGAGFGADGATSGKTFAQAFERAQSARLTVRIAAAEVDSAAARVAQARAQLFPTLDLSYNADRINNHDTFSGVDAEVEIPQLNTTSRVTVTQTVPRYQTSATLGAQYRLYTGGRLRAQLNQDELSLQAADVRRELALQQVALDVSSAYFRLRRACMRVSSADRQLRHAQDVAQVTSQRLRDGRVAAIEERVATLTVAEKQTASRARLDDLELAYAGYQASTQNTAPAEQATEQRCRFANSIEADLDQVRQLSDQTLDARYDSLNLAAARERVAVTRAALRPQITLYSNYSGIGRSDNSLRDSLSHFSYRQFNIGFQLTFNLFDHGLAARRVSEAESEYRKQALLADQAADERAQQKQRRALNARMVDTHIDLLRSRLDLATAQADMARQQLKANTIGAAAAEERFEQEQDARDELHVAQIDAVLASLATLFPTRTLKEP